MSTSKAIFLPTYRNNAPYDLNTLAESEEISIIVASNNLLVHNSIYVLIFSLQRKTFHSDNIFELRFGLYDFINWIAGQNVITYEYIQLIKYFIKSAGTLFTMSCFQFKNRLISSIKTFVIFLTVSAFIAGVPIISGKKLVESAIYGSSTSRTELLIYQSWDHNRFM